MSQSRSRRLAREAAFQALYMVQVGRDEAEAAVETVTARQAFTGDAESFLQTTVEEITDREAEIDDLIRPHLAKNWTLERIAVSDLVALRIATFELWFRPGIPPKVSITEALELAKRYGSKDSGAFVNGVLANVLKESPKNEWDSSLEEKPETEEGAVSMPDEPDVVEEGSEPVSLVEPEGAVAGKWVIRSEDEEDGG